MATNYEKTPRSERLDQSQSNSFFVVHHQLRVPLKSTTGIFKGVPYFTYTVTEKGLFLV
ncbi:MAG: hypothetical protein CM1200mP39_25540 [Dehalococcoidia bacterium]|nr:MAG: hypothetical protein CM1200mP39_25540 [Dehalococcoidia bacterium]